MGANSLPVKGTRNPSRVAMTWAARRTTNLRKAITALRDRPGNAVCGQPNGLDGARESAGNGLSRMLPENWRPSASSECQMSYMLLSRQKKI